eukprot:CAMPEP_0117667418 /NCGR_PEP_ID=MMETSP0804-20121206/10955_1 /TAXON_ID=1074897 /ORGANISM="Tetraselmis astigmatica, Strain CCMP880" /LENGTH=121 /DNA_ID=CAMNT_0005475141 /DNA_START=393 /DNA_END=759 /DNA_ORIENTATION=+
MVAPPCTEGSLGQLSAELLPFAPAPTLSSPAGFPLSFAHFSWSEERSLGRCRGGGDSSQIGQTLIRLARAPDSSTDCPNWEGDSNSNLVAGLLKLTSEWHTDVCIIDIAYAAALKWGMQIQ